MILEKFLSIATIKILWGGNFICGQMLTPSHHYLRPNEVSMRGLDSNDATRALRPVRVRGSFHTVWEYLHRVLTNHVYFLLMNEEGLYHYQQYKHTSNCEQANRRFIK